MFSDLVIIFISGDDGQSKTVAVAVAQYSVVSVREVLQGSPLEHVIGPPDWHRVNSPVLWVLPAVVSQ